MLGVAYHLTGDHANAQQHCERGLEKAMNPDAAQAVYFGYDQQIRGLVALARTLWFRGFPDRAAKIAERAIDEAVRRNHPIDLRIAMIYSATVFLWRGDLSDAEQLIQRLSTLSTRHSLGPYHAVSLALTAEVAIARGDAREGIANLRVALELLQSEQHQILTPAFQRALAEGLLQTRQFAEAAAVLDAAIAQSGDCAYGPNTIELHRIRGETWLQTPHANLDAAEQEFQLSLQAARSQSALSLELRSGTALAQLWSRRGKTLDAVHLLHSIYDRFDEGHLTADLTRADRTLADLKERLLIVPPGNLNPTQ
jgi:ATP/maltotriose-dependent transcriptional regulator MalT